MKSEWETLVDDELGTLRLEFNRGMVFLHVTLRKPMAAMRAIRDRFPTLKEMLRNMGYKQVHVIIPEGDEKLYRFETMFGFRELRRARGHILMRQET